MTRTITVRGMHCDGCEQTVEDAVESVDGVRAAEADEEDEAVEVEGEVDIDDIVRAVEDAGYEASA